MELLVTGHNIKIIRKEETYEDILKDFCNESFNVWWLKNKKKRLWKSSALNAWKQMFSAGAVFSKQFVTLSAKNFLPYSDNIVRISDCFKNGENAFINVERENTVGELVGCNVS